MKSTVLIPQYYHDFQCIGGECEDTCCSGWSVYIDKKTYNKYQQFKDPELGDMVKKSFVKLDQDKATDVTYAQLKMNERGYCPALNDKGLCSLHYKYGEKALSPVCLSYPRILNDVDNVFEISTALSCPESARLALLNPHGIDFDMEEMEVNDNYLVGRKVNSETGAEIERYFWPLREFTIEILQYREISFVNRMLFLGLFLQRVQQSVNDGEINVIPSIVEEYRIKLCNKTYTSSLARVNVDYEYQLNIFIQLLEIRRSLMIPSKVYIKLIQSTLEGLKWEEDTPIEQVSALMEKGFQEYFKPYFEDKEYIFENYFVNHVFSRLFPIGSNRDLFEEFEIMAFFYSMIKIHLVGIALHDGGLTEKSVIQLFYSFTRSIEHSNSFIKRVLDEFKEKKVNSLANMALLIADK